ncbi:MAG: DUF2441 domain-containing protein [Akkermansiaceae bacterium]|nr:DUF2441 domain-containing protein [Armatimonadota bacterium]
MVQEDSAIDIMDSITVGTRLFCAADAVLPVGSELSGGGFGRRELARSVLQQQVFRGEELRALFDLGPLAVLDDLDLNRPRSLSAVKPTVTVRVLGELVWEVVRLREFPNRPSRLDCLFLWERELDARDWFSRRTWPSSLYEVEVTKIPNRVFVADLGLVQFSSPDGNVLGLMQRARHYWSQDGNTSRNPEVLLEGTVVIRRECAS